MRKATGLESLGGPGLDPEYAVLRRARDIRVDRDVVIAVKLQTNRTGLVKLVGRMLELVSREGKLTPGERKQRHPLECGARLHELAVLLGHPVRREALIEGTTLQD